MCSRDCKYEDYKGNCIHLIPPYNGDCMIDSVQESEAELKEKKQQFCKDIDKCDSWNDEQCPGCNALDFFMAGVVC